LLRAVTEADAIEKVELNADSKKAIADRFLRLAELPTYPLDRLSRYEHMICPL
jgi:hypothetical protein